MPLSVRVWLAVSSCSVMYSEIIAHTFFPRVYAHGKRYSRCLQVIWKTTTHFLAVSVGKGKLPFVDHVHSDFDFCIRSNRGSGRDDLVKAGGWLCWFLIFFSSLTITLQTTDDIRKVHNSNIMCFNLYFSICRAKLGFNFGHHQPVSFILKMN